MLYYQVLPIISVAKPCHSTFLIVFSGKGVVRSGSSLSASKSRICFWNVGHLYFVSSGSLMGSHLTLISSLSEDA